MAYPEIVSNKCDSYFVKTIVVIHSNIICLYKVQLYVCA